MAFVAGLLVGRHNPAKVAVVQKDLGAVVAAAQKEVTAVKAKL